MKNINLKEKTFPFGLIFIAMLMFFNPNINILDILPDFIGYLLLAAALVHAARRVPFFEEARLGFLKLALLSFLKYPALFLMIMIKGKNTLDNDSFLLFSFSFAVIELILAIPTVNNLFSGIAYLGERTGAQSLIGKNPSADNLKILTLVFTAVKCALYTIPDFLLLTSVEDAGSPTTLMPASRYYLLVLIICQVIGYLFGIVWLAFFLRYLSVINSSGEFYPAVMQLTDDEREAQITYKIKKSKVLTGLGILPVAALLSFDFKLSEFRGTNVLPHFIIGILILVAIHKISTIKSRLTFSALILGGVYTAFSVVTWLFEIYYHDNYSRVAAVFYDDARTAFNVFATLSVIESLMLVSLLVLLTLLLCRFVRMHTGKAPPDVIDPLAQSATPSEYSVYDKKYHTSLSVKAFIFLAIGVISTAAKLIYVFTNNTREFADASVVLIPSVAPWLGTLTIGISVVWTVYTVYFTNILKEDFDLKYSDTKISHS